MQNNQITARDEIKKYFQTGDRPTEAQFAEFLNSYTHLNEFNFGISAKSSADAEKKYYHFYTADTLKNPVGHLIEEGEEEPEDAGLEAASEKREGGIIGREHKNSAAAEYKEGYKHILSRKVFYKKIVVTLNDAIDIESQKPKIIIERYRQTKKKLGPDGTTVRKKGYLKENNTDAQNAKRKSEYIVDKHEMVIDLEPIHYFRPADNYKDFAPSGSLKRKGSYLMTKCYKPFELVRMRLQIQISGKTFLSHPVNFKIVLGSSDEYDPINFIFD